MKWFNRHCFFCYICETKCLGIWGMIVVTLSEIYLFPNTNFKLLISFWAEIINRHSKSNGTVLFCIVSVLMLVVPSLQHLLLNFPKEKCSIYPPSPILKIQKQCLMNQKASLPKGKHHPVSIFWILH